MKEVEAAKIEAGGLDKTPEFYQSMSQTARIGKLIGGNVSNTIPRVTETITGQVTADEFGNIEKIISFSGEIYKKPPVIAGLESDAEGARPVNGISKLGIANLTIAGFTFASQSLIDPFEVIKYKVRVINLDATG